MKEIFEDLLVLKILNRVKLTSKADDPIADEWLNHDEVQICLDWLKDKGFIKLSNTATLSDIMPFELTYLGCKFLSTHNK